MAQINFNHDGVGHFISDNFVKVPVYQRPYSWDKENVYDFFNDIGNVYPEEYFIGTIVLTKKDGHLEIIDGQQRIATTIIFYSALRNFMLEIKNEEAARQYESDYLFRKVLKTGEVNPKIALGAEDNDFFEKKIIQINGAIKNALKSSHQRIEDAYKIALSFIRQEYSAHGKVLEHLYDLADFIRNQVQIIIVSVDDDTNAFTVFETLNDRGLALSQTDLIKNYLFNKAGSSRLNEAQQKWTSFKSAIEAAENENEILEYIRYHWSSKEGLTREKELFKKIKEKIKTTAQVITYLTELENDVQIYLPLLNPNHEKWNEYDPTCRDYIKTLLDLNLTRLRPLLISIMKKFSKQDALKALRLMVAWSVRNLITGTTPGGTLEVQFSSQAKLINTGSLKSYSDLKKSLKDLIPTDESFKKAFEIAHITKAPIARYYLSEIELSYHTTKEQETSKNTENVNLEHILPEKANLKTDWSNFSEEQHKSYCNRIGNLTLMDKKMNSDEKSSSFKNKQKTYAKSEIKITNELSDSKKIWNTAEIEQRQKDFAKQAVKIWKINF
jgi:hypothetical protein